MGLEAAVLGDAHEVGCQSEQHALAQAFWACNELPQRWQQRTHFVILQTGFGAGAHFLSTWAAWLADPQRCQRLVFVAVDKQPPGAADLAQMQALAHPQAALLSRLHAAWPPMTAGLHTLEFDHPERSPTGHMAQVKLILAVGDPAAVLPSLMLQADAFYLDGFGPAPDAVNVDLGALARLQRLAAPGATVATSADATAVREALTHAGFTFEPKNLDEHSKLITGHFAPRHTPAPLPGGLWPSVPEAHRHAIVLGAGLAGCSAARALCRQGWRVTLLDAHDGPAQEASGNPGGLFHSILHGDDGIHARAHRAAALATWALAAPWMRTQVLPGQCDGLLRLDGKTSPEQAQALLHKQGLGDDHVQWLTQAQASDAAGLTVPSGGWLFKQGGWLQPPKLARLMLADAAQPCDEGGAPLLNTRFGQAAHRIAPNDQGQWQVFDENGVLLAQAPSLVLANAHAAQSLLHTLPPERAVADLPTSRVRGQISAWPDTSAEFMQVTMPKLPVAGSGYVLPLGQQGLLFGATTQHHDDPNVRESDHRHNLAQAQRLGAIDMTAARADAPLPDGLQGRTGWRATTPDRLPLVGAMPWSASRLVAHPQRTRLDQVRLIPRERTLQGGLYAITGLGSRGITWAPLAGELLAHWVCGAPCPIETELRDALDPARFLAREQRKPNSPRQPTPSHAKA